MRRREIQKLPRARREGPLSLEETLAARRSVRSFRSRVLTTEEVAQLCWSLQGVTSPEGDRTAPSAGGLLPLETYVGSPRGFFRYHPGEHALERLAADDPRPAVFRAALRQEAVLEAPAFFLIAAVLERMARKYGLERSPRYIHMEAGHAAQNLLLQAVALGLGAVVIGAFDDDELQTVLGLPPEHRPLYLIPVGEPRG